MIETRGLNPYVSFISSQFKSGGEVGTPVRRAVTISRQAGCGALVVAEKLADYLQAHTLGDARPWTVYDSNLIDKVLADHGLPPYLAKFLREDRVSQLEDLMADVLGALPPTATIIKHVTETMHGLVASGNVILIRKYFNADIDDPLLYHMIINTGQMGYEAAAKVIGDAVLDPG
jgi:hypothetical protein